MRTALLIFRREAPDSASPQLLFACPALSTLSLEMADWTLDDFAARNGLERHPTYDWHAGDGGRTRALLEWKPPAPDTLTPPLTFRGPSGDWSVDWLPFPLMARKLPLGSERNALQLAVQFLSTGGIDDSVLGVEYDAPFLETLKNALAEEQPPTAPPPRKP